MINDRFGSNGGNVTMLRGRDKFAKKKRGTKEQHPGFQRGPPP